VSRLERILLTFIPLTAVGIAIAILAVVLPLSHFLVLKGLVLLTSVYLGKFVILVPVLEKDVPFSPLFLAVMVTIMDICTAFVVGANLDALYKIPWAGKKLRTLEDNGRLTLERKPWVRRSAALGIVLFVMFPATGTGAIVATVLGRLLGLNLWRLFLAIAMGAVLGCGAMALGAVALAQTLEPVRETLWFRLSGLFALALFIAFLIWQAYRGSRTQPPVTK
jgi:uncharacterized membrane protein